MALGVELGLLLNDALDPHAPVGAGRGGGRGGEPPPPRRPAPGPVPDPAPALAPVLAPSAKPGAPTPVPPLAPPPLRRPDAVPADLAPLDPTPAKAGPSQSVAAGFEIIGPLTAGDRAASQLPPLLSLVEALTEALAAPEDSGAARAASDAIAARASRRLGEAASALLTFVGRCHERLRGGKGPVPPPSTRLACLRAAGRILAEIPASAARMELLACLPWALGETGEKREEEGGGGSLSSAVPLPAGTRFLLPALRSVGSDAEGARELARRGVFDALGRRTAASAARLAAGDADETSATLGAAACLEALLSVLPGFSAGAGTTLSVGTVRDLGAALPSAWAHLPPILRMAPESAGLASLGARVGGLACDSGEAAALFRPALDLLPALEGAGVGAGGPDADDRAWTPERAALDGLLDALADGLACGGTRVVGTGTTRSRARVAAARLGGEGWDAAQLIATALGQ